MSAVLDAASATSRAHGRLWGAAKLVVADPWSVTAMVMLADAVDALELAEAELSEALASRPDAWPARGWRIAS
jgi:hypothetical protein